MLSNESLYGGYVTSTFSNIWPSFDVWNAEYAEYKELIQLAPLKKQNTIKTVYYLLCAEYAFSHHIGSRDQFKLMMFARVSEYAPYFEKELEVQTDLLSMGIDTLQQGSKAIYNSALNPGKSPSTQSLEELTHINQQNVTNYKKSKPEAYAVLISLLDKNLARDFVERFRDLFIKVCYPDYPLYYENDPSLTGGE